MNKYFIFLYSILYQQVLATIKYQLLLSQFHSEHTGIPNSFLNTF